jgi:hypothetical protein
MTTLLMQEIKTMLGNSFLQDPLALGRSQFTVFIWEQMLSLSSAKINLKYLKPFPGSDPNRSHLSNSPNAAQNAAQEHQKHCQNYFLLNFIFESILSRLVNLSFLFLENDSSQ